MFVNKPSSNTNNTFTFVQMADPQLGMGGYTHDTDAFKYAIEQINDLKPAFVVICGDLVDDACSSSFDDFKKIKSGFEIPVHLAPGNHDLENTPTDKTLDHYRKEFGKDYYSFDYAASKFVIVNTQLWKTQIKGESTIHNDWFLSTIRNAEKDSKNIFIVGHYPLFVNSLNEEENYFNLPVKKRLELLDLYKRHGVIAHLGGHAHKSFEHKIEDIHFVNGETTSLNFDNRPLGFRLWSVKNNRISNKFIELNKVPSNEIKLFNNSDSLTRKTGTR